MYLLNTGLAKVFAAFELEEILLEFDKKKLVVQTVQNKTRLISNDAAMYHVWRRSQPVIFGIFTGNNSEWIVVDLSPIYIQWEIFNLMFNFGTWCGQIRKESTRSIVNPSSQIRPKAIALHVRSRLREGHSNVQSIVHSMHSQLKLLKPQRISTSSEESIAYLKVQQSTRRWRSKVLIRQSQRQPITTVYVRRCLTRWSKVRADTQTHTLTRAHKISLEILKPLSHNNSQYRSTFIVFREIEFGTSSLQKMQAHAVRLCFLPAYRHCIYLLYLITT